jgi:hypothetical protein
MYYWEFKEFFDSFPVSTDNGSTMWISFSQGIQITKFLQTLFRDYRYQDKISDVASQIWNHLPKEIHDIPQGFISESESKKITEKVEKIDASKRSQVLSLLPGDQEESLPG